MTPRRPTPEEPEDDPEEDEADTSVGSDSTYNQTVMIQIGPIGPTQ